MTAPRRDESSADRMTNEASARTELPQTASPLPLVALLGLGSLVGAGALRLRR
jgi:LPXTG-motif cell wall-anchored protein